MRMGIYNVGVDAVCVVGVVDDVGDGCNGCECIPFVLYVCMYVSLMRTTGHLPVQIEYPVIPIFFSVCCSIVGRD